jgi:hypothetical protein
MNDPQPRIGDAFELEALARAPSSRESSLRLGGEAGCVRNWRLAWRKSSRPSRRSCSERSPLLK